MPTHACCTICPRPFHPHPFFPRCRAVLGVPAEAVQLPAIAGLTRLRRACFDAEPAALPAGAWVTNLQELGAPHDPQLLRAAPRLEKLTVFKDYDYSKAGPESGVWRWCAMHPSLQEVHIELPSPGPVPSVLLVAVTELQSARPALRVSCHLNQSPLSIELDYDN